MGGSGEGEGSGWIESSVSMHFTTRETDRASGGAAEQHTELGPAPCGDLEG